MNVSFRSTRRTRRSGSGAHRRHRPRRGLLAGLAVVLCVVAVPVVAPTPASALVTGPTVVSLTFDDSTADQAVAEQSLVRAGLRGTFYTVSGWVGQPGYLSRADLTRFAADGNEIGGHTITHPDLTETDPAEAERQICRNRATLEDWGFKPTSFAYPYASSNAPVEALARGCGYLTSRGLGDVRSPRSCTRCIVAETRPPADPQYLRAPDQVDGTWTLAQLQREVTQAVNGGGGWVVLTFHQVCAPLGTAACPTETSITPTLYNAFVTWLAAYSRVAANKTSVATVDQAVRGYLGASYPAYSPAPRTGTPAPAPVGVNALTNASVEDANAATGFPRCWQPGGWGANTPSWSTITPGHTGATAAQLVVTGYSSGDAKLLPTLDLGACAPTAVPGATYDVGTWYRSTGLSQFALYYSDAAGAWHYWTSSPWFGTATDWSQATFTTPPVPAGAVSLSFGLALISDGTLQTDDYSLVRPSAVAARVANPAVASRQVTPHRRSLAHARRVLSRTSPALNAVVRTRPSGVVGGVRVSAPRPFVPGRGRLSPGQRFAVPELRLEAGLG